MTTLSYSDISGQATEVAMWLIDQGLLDDLSAGIQAYESKYGKLDAEVITRARSFADTYAGELEVSNAYSTCKPAKRVRKTAAPILFKKEQENTNLVNRAIREGYVFFVCRTINKKVERLPLTALFVNLQTGQYTLAYRNGDELVTEKASAVDLVIIQQTAQKFAAALQERGA